MPGLRHHRQIAATFLTWSVAALISAPQSATSQECASYPAGDEIAVLADERIDEASGLAASWRNEGLLWVHNDSGDSARLFLIDLAGQTKTVVELGGPATAVDWEDIAIGPCTPDDPTPCVWVGDIGDNNEVRTDVALYRFVEPLVPEDPPATIVIEDVTKIDVSYEGGPRNAETLMVHPVDGRVFIVDKTVGDPSNLWIVPTDGVTPASIIATTSFGEIGIVSGRVTGGDFSPSGDEFSVRTYHFIYTFCGAPEQAFDGPRSSVIGTRLYQSESLTYARDGSRLYTTTEVERNRPAPLLEMVAHMQGQSSDVGMVAPDVARVRTDAGPPEEEANGGLVDMEIGLLDERRSSCSCASAGAGAELIWLVVVVLGGRRARRCKRVASDRDSSYDSPT